MCEKERKEEKKKKIKRKKEVMRYLPRDPASVTRYILRGHIREREQRKRHEGTKGSEGENSTCVFLGEII